MCIFCSLCSCDTPSDEEFEYEDVEIVNSYVNDLGNKVFVLSDGGMVELVIDPARKFDKVIYYSKDYKKLSSDYDHSARFTQWLNAEISGYATCTRYKGKTLYYVYKPAPDMTTERIVVKINKYDGNLNQINGKMELSGGLLTGTSGSGELSGEGMGSKNMFINIYFDGSDPISVNAKENTLWLDVEVGDTIVEKRINGKTHFTPKF